ncbi:hypothetical protein [Streptomyces sp. NPDC052036]
MRTLQTQLHDHHVPDDIEPLQLAVHVGERLRLDLNRLPPLARTVAQ